MHKLTCYLVCVIFFSLVLESTCNNVAINPTSKMSMHTDFNDVVGSTHFKDDDKRKSFTPKQIDYDKYHLPSYKEQYLMGKNGIIQ